MDLGRNDSIVDKKDLQNDSFWVPLTPLKPHQPKPQPIYANEQENSLKTEKNSAENRLEKEDLSDSGSPPGFSRQSGENSVFACSGSPNPVNVTSGFDNWEDLAMKPQIFDENGGLYNRFSLDSVENCNNMPFTDLLALAQGSTNTVAATNAYQIGSVSMTDRVWDGLQCGSSGPSQLADDPHSPPRITRDANMSRISTPQFAPFTPDQAKRAENKQLSDTQSTSADERTNQTRDALDNEVATTRVEVRYLQHEKEQRPMPEESSCAAICTQLEENHSPDNGGEQGIDLNKTPQQKPRRRKHRPKVVIEGKPKRTRKPATPKPSNPNETPTGKRKYVRRKGLDKSATPSVGVTGENTEPKTAENTTIHPSVGVTSSIGNTEPKPAENTATNPSIGVTSTSRNTEPKTAENTENSCRKSMNSDFEVWLAEKEVKSCRRSLNFDFGGQTGNESSSLIQPSRSNSESQAQNFCTKDQAKSTVQLGQGIEVMVEKTQMGIAYDLTRSMNQVLQGYISLPERQPQRASIPTKADPPQGKLKDDAANECTRGKCRIVFSNQTHDKQEDTLQGSPNNSNCSSSACITQEDQMRGQKRAHSCTLNEAQLGNMNATGFNYNGNMNATGLNYNALQAYMMVPVIDVDHNNQLNYMHVPAIAKKNRTEKGQHSTTSSSKSTITAAENSMRQSTTYHPNNASSSSLTSGTGWRVSTAQFTSSSTPTKVAALNSTQSNQKTIERMMALNQKEGLTKKGSDEQTRVQQVRDFAKLVGVVEYQQPPTFPAGGVPTSGNTQRLEASQQTQPCMEALLAETRQAMPTKRRRNSRVNSVPPSAYDHLQFFAKLKGPYSDIMLRNIFTIDAIVEQMKQLKINEPRKRVANRQRALVPYKRRYKEQNAIVLYQMDGTVVPYEGKKRKPRAKVDLDDETSRVWKLLLENINSEGIDGTDEEKARWWEEERKVFHGRADSFIARMHLVQGDRRFSPWKGSVVDSVVGVFLTQNVSDHLSSSAFMSLAARFPLKSKSNHIPCSEDSNGILVEEPDICILEPEDTIKWHEEKVNQPVCDQSSMTLQDVTCNEEKVVNSNETSGSNSARVRLTNNSIGELLDSSGNGPQRYNVSASVTVENSMDDERELDDVVSSQNSVVSSQNSVDSSTVSPTDRVGSCSQSNSEDLTIKSTTQRPNGGPSFMELLQMAGNTARYGIHKHVTGNMSSNNGHNQDKSSVCGGECIDIEEEGRFSDIAKKTEGNYWSKQSGLTTESTNQAKVQETLTVHFEETSLSSNSITGNGKNTGHNPVKSNLDACGYPHGKTASEINLDILKGKRVKVVKEKENKVEWDNLRKQALANGEKRERKSNTQDSVDWETVRTVNVGEIADAIKERGMNNMLAERIQDFLNRIVREHGSIDLEWLRDVPPDKAKEYLLSVRGLGLKSVECVRLLTLHHLAFPVDTNVGRIAVRLGWVPLQPLPEALQLHLLELYPILESIQKYLWPRLCKLDQRTLYELHYQMITFGKVFCTKSKPNCNACPMRGECRHFASAFASARLALPGPEEKSIVCAAENKAANQNPAGIINPLQLPMPPTNHQPEALCEIINREPIIEEPASPEPIIEIPATPEPEHAEITESNTELEDIGCEDPEEIPTIKLNIEEFTQNLQNYMQRNMELQEGDMSKALVALTTEAASIPMPKLKYLNRLRTEHQVYELPDSHPLLEGLDKREPDDPCSYLLAIWTPGETADSIQPPERRCSSQDYSKLCDEKTCFSCNSIREANSQTVRGTLLIPCRTAMRGSFPLNGTYFQVNEVFADHDSSINPIDVPRTWIWNLPRRTVYFGTSIPTIFKGLSTEGIQYCFWRGFVCVRGFDQKTRGPRPLLARLHFPASKLTKTKDRTDE